MDFEVPDNEVCEQVLEHRQKLREWEQKHGKQTKGAKVKPTDQTPEQSTHSVRHAFHLLVCAERQRNGGDRQRAIRAVARKEPGLYAEYQRTLPKGGPTVGGK